MTLRRQGNHVGALVQFRKAVEINPKDPEAQFNLGMELKAGGDLAGAITAFQRAIELKPDFEKAHYNLGIALRAQGKTGAAKKELEELSALHDFRARLAQAKYLTLTGVDALKQAKLDDALALFQKSIEQAPELPTGTTMRRHVGSAKGRRTSAGGVRESARAEAGLCAGPLKPRPALLAPERSHTRARRISAGGDVRPRLGGAALQPRTRAGTIRTPGRSRSRVHGSRQCRSQVHRRPDTIGIDPQPERRYCWRSQCLPGTGAPRSSFAEAHNNLGLVLLQSGMHLRRRAEFREAVRPQARLCGRRTTILHWPFIRKEKRQNRARSSRRRTRLRRS